MSLPLLLATTALFNCLEIQSFIDNIPRDDLSHQEYTELVETFKDAGPARCIYHTLPPPENNLADKDCK